MYAEHAPPAALAGVVACFWCTATGDGIAGHRVMPDGAIDIVLTYDGDEVVSADVAGTMTTALVVPPTTTRSVGVRFLPGAAAAVLGVDADELTDRLVPLRHVWPRADVDDVRALLMRRVALGVSTPRDIAAAVASIRGSRGRLRVSELGPSLGMSRQQLARRFARTVGVSPKTFARTMRFQTLLERARAATRVAPDWSGLAHELGYVDQSHLVNDFGALAGLTPTAWFQNSKTAAPVALSIGA
jgi:AraC-like DNA-binding protein